jgi:hypothetical protein
MRQGRTAEATRESEKAAQLAPMGSVQGNQEE